LVKWLNEGLVGIGRQAAALLYSGLLINYKYIIIVDSIDLG